MKRKTRNLIYKIMILVVAALYAFFPFHSGNDITSQHMINSIGLDSGEGIITATVEAAGKENQAIVGSGGTLNLALSDINSKIGRNIDIAHCGLIVLGSGITTKETLSCLMQLLSEGKINAGCSVITAETSAEEFINNALKVDSGKSGVTDYITYVDEYLRISVEKLISFVGKIKSKSAAAALPILGVHEKKDSVGGGSKTNTAEGGGSQPQPAEEKKSEMTLTETAKTYGSKELVMDKAVTRGYNWMYNMTGSSLATIDNFSFKEQDFGIFSADIEKKSVKLKLIDSAHAEINAKMKLHTVNRDKLLDAVITTECESREINDALGGQFAEYVRRDLQSLVDFCKTDAVDILGLSNEVYKYRTKDFTSMNEILQKTDVAVNVEVTIY